MLNHRPSRTEPKPFMSGARAAVLAAALAASSCAPLPAVTPHPAPSETSTVAPAETITVSPGPSSVTTEPTTIYAGPGNVHYPIIAEVPQGTYVYPTGSFGDFVRVEHESRVGYVLEAALDRLPRLLPELLPGDVPPQSIDLLELIYDPGTTRTEGHATVNRLHSDDWGGGYDIGPIALTTPFSVEIDMTRVGDNGAVTLTGRVPQAGREWWEGRRTLYVFATGSIEIRDGQSESSIYTREISSLRGKAIRLAFADPQGRTVTLGSPSGEEWATIDVTSLPRINLSDGLFPDRALYFGTLVAPHSSLTIERLELLRQPDGAFQAQPTTLRSLADQNNLMLGTIVDWYTASDLRNQDAVLSEFNSATVELGWAAVEPERGEFDFSLVDQAVDFASRNNMRVTLLHLIWGAREQLPRWLVRGNFTRDELREILHDYIVKVTRRYKGKVYIYSVANEYTSRQLWGGDFWYDRLGPEYVEMAFQWAHDADPTALLMLNEDVKAEPPDALIVTRMLSNLEQWKDRGVPIDAVGMQMHLLSPFSDGGLGTAQDVVQTMRAFSELGYLVFVTEFDVSLHNVPGTNQAKLSYQARVYEDMLAACLESELCRGFTIFGVSDAVSWYRECDGCLNLPDAEPTIFDTNYDPKPAYFALWALLQRNAP